MYVTLFPRNAENVSVAEIRSKFQLLVNNAPAKRLPCKRLMYFIADAPMRSYFDSMRYGFEFNLETKKQVMALKLAASAHYHVACGAVPLVAKLRSLEFKHMAGYSIRHSSLPILECIEQKNDLLFLQFKNFSRVKPFDLILPYTDNFFNIASKYMHAPSHTAIGIFLDANDNEMKVVML